MIRPIRSALVAAVSLGALMLAVASPALAAKHPKGEFAGFKECPTNNAEVEDCITAKTEGGEFQIGKEKVPITNPITLSGGVDHFGSSSETFFPAENPANTLSNSPQKVPGGLLGLVKCPEISNFIERIACELVFENGATGVNATTEIAGSPSSIKISAGSLLAGVGTALALPIKIHLENPLLGSSCYIGSNSAPVLIEFTSGTTSPPAPNKPITGKPGEFSVNETGTLLSVLNNELVNNSYPSPAVEGCGGVFSFLIDPIVDSKLGLPSAAGKNTAILKGTLKIGVVEAVKASE
jgi:hypothetical protein